MRWKKVTMLCAALVLTAGLTFAWEPPAKAPNRNPNAAMWLSIGHPALGEWYNAGWGGWQNCNRKKFFLGFIPGYGWPGYLQVRSAITARRGGTW